MSLVIISSNFEQIRIVDASGLDDMDHATVERDAPVHDNEVCVATNFCDQLKDTILSQPCRPVLFFIGDKHVTSEMCHALENSKYIYHHVQLF
jgi:hypothetical protein